jgi:hypothetical protein
MEEIFTVIEMILAISIISRANFHYNLEGFIRNAQLYDIGGGGLVSHRTCRPSFLSHRRCAVNAGHDQ